MENFTEDNYLAIWRMHRLYGSPKVDFSFDFSERMTFGSRAYYIPDSNAMYLGINYYRTAEQYVDDWLSELAHSFQWQHYPREVMNIRQKNEEDYIDSLLNIPARTRYGTILTAGEIKDIIFYQKQDSIKGYHTIEYEAHTIIEPFLIKKYLTMSKVVL